MSTLDIAKSLISTKKGTVKREIALNACIENKPILNILEHYGDEQDALSDENIQKLLEQNNQEYVNLNRLRVCK